MKNQNISKDFHLSGSVAQSGRALELYGETEDLDIRTQPSADRRIVACSNHATPINNSKYLILAELIGAIIGDGHIWKINNSAGFGITGNIEEDKDYFKYLSKIIEKLWNRKPRIFIRQRARRLIFSSKEAFSYLTDELKLPYGKRKGISVTIPNQISKKKELTLSCLRGIFDTDGSFFYSKKPGIEKYPTIEISTISKNLAVQIFYILKNYNFRIKIRKQKSYRENQQIRYILSLNGAKETAKWFKMIGSKNPRHYNKLKQIDC